MEKEDKNKEDKNKEEKDAKKEETKASSKGGKKVKDSSYWGQTMNLASGEIAIGKDGSVDEKHVEELSKFLPMA